MIDYNFNLRKKNKLEESSRYNLAQDESVLDVYRYDLEFQRQINSDKRKYGGEND